jgi:putative DNA methylase
LVDDPSAWPELFPTEEEQEAERQRLFRIIEELVKWESTTNQTVLLAAQTEIARSIARNRGEDVPEGADAIRKYIEENAPPVLDPFCGGGIIPLEAQRLGLCTYASDLNPVAVIITKALIEIPSKFAGNPPVNPEARKEKTLLEKEWRGAEGLAEDVRYYGKWMRDEAEKRIGHLYPKVKLTEEVAKDRPDLKPYLGQELTVIAWLWARTVECPNPSCHSRTPLIHSFWLSKKKNNLAYIEPILNTESREVLRFEVRTEGEPRKSTTDRTGARCIFCDTFVKKSQLRDIAVGKGTDPIQIAIVAKSDHKRIFLSSDALPLIDNEKTDMLFLEQPIADNPRWFSPPLYGMRNFVDLFTNRQLTTLSALSGLVREAWEKVLADALVSETFPEDDRSFVDDGQGPRAYSDAIATYLGEAISKSTAFHCVLSTWRDKEGKSARAFGRQAMPMVWDYAEVNPFADAGGSLDELFDACYVTIQRLPARASSTCKNIDASSTQFSGQYTVSTDPPYYDNIGYSDLSDFYYIWLRNILKDLYPLVFSTVVTPKKQELIATPYRSDTGQQKTKEYFEQGLSKVFSQMRIVQAHEYPLIVYYAFKPAETENADSSMTKAIGTSIASTGWETMLESLIGAKFCLLGTWPIRTESVVGLKQVINVLASSIIIVCRPRPEDAPMTTRRDFIAALKGELPRALIDLQHGNIAPVDLAQASIGPGMAVFTRYSKVMEADGSPMTVRAALALINQALDEVLAEQEGEFDADTRWAVAWFEQFGMEEGLFGVAETLSKAKDTSVNGMVEAGILFARAGKVRLLRREELFEDWDPAMDNRFTIWEATQYLIRALDQKGEQGAAELLRKLGALGESARDLAYRLYSICERKKWAQEALAYNGLVIAWPEITRLAQGAPISAEAQTGLFESE